MRRFLVVPILLLVLLAGLSRPAFARGHSEAGSAADLLAAVNALRAGSGLPVYQVDANLMASAQAHSDYQASIGQATHTRADGSGPDSFIENIASGYNLDVQTVLSTIWADQLHQDTMLAFSEGYAGTGAAVRDGVVYYTLQVRRGPGAAVNTSAALQVPPAGAAQDSTPQPGAVVPGFSTQAPQPDGSVVHVVQEGESLWSIAVGYSISIADLVKLNNLAPTPVIFPSQKLIIRAAFTPTTSPTTTRTPRPLTRTPTPTWTPRPPTTVPTPAPTATPTPFSLLNALPDIPSTGSRSIGIGLIVVCGAGLLAVLLTSFRKK